MADTTDTQALSRAEQYLQSAITGESDGLPTPRSREEQFLKHCVERCGCDGLPTPRSRREKYLYTLAETMAGGGSGETENTLNQYLLGTKTDITAEDLAGVDVIGNFGGSRITSVTIPDSVDTIKSSAFAGCQSLVSVTMGSGVVTIQSNAFDKCTALRSFVFGSSVTTTYNRIFNGCTALEYVVIPASMTRMGDGAFYGCAALKKVVCLSETPPTIGGNTFNGVPADCIFEVLATSVEAYKSAPTWIARADYIVAKEGT